MQYRPDAGLSRGTEEEMKMELTLRERDRSADFYPPFFFFSLFLSFLFSVFSPCFVDLSFRFRRASLVIVIIIIPSMKLSFLITFSDFMQVFAFINFIKIVLSLGFFSAELNLGEI